MHLPPRPPAEPLITQFLITRAVYVSLLAVAATFLIFQWELGRLRGSDTRNPHRVASGRHFKIQSFKVVSRLQERTLREAR